MPVVSATLLKLDGAAIPVFARRRHSGLQSEGAVAAKDWFEGADDWGEEGEEMAAFGGHSLSHGPGGASESAPGEIVCAMQLQDFSLQETPGLSHPAKSQHPPCKESVVPSCIPIFQPYYISVVDEEDYLGYSKDSGHAELLLQDCTPSGCEERYEKTEKGDQVFHRFMKRISVCQEQLLRYSWDVSVEFGTAFVFTCEKSCWPPNHPSPFEEYIYVQEDPDQHLLNRTLHQ
ncbi:hypothetical protein JD844_000066 [Phrynosoma platyrhinos]|uniref:Programmed cell death protein 2 C-terminal domain-containing protein n=1 Tax=Phrynosoma platyrhinos TaxID=52577 RepID=A0ABQ7SQ38_PHRPL|nr:hypothetical protein JD844_000066 [Phrynosoma platyrhinos]